MSTTRFRSNAVFKRTLVLRILLIALLLEASPVFSQALTQKAQLTRRSLELASQQQLEKSAAVATALKLGMPVRRISPDGTVFELQRLERGMPVYYVTQNAQEARAIATDKLWPEGASGLSLTGAGQSIGIWDAGLILATHQEATGRIQTGDGAKSVAAHATHVAGTMIASGIDPEARGMAYQARLQSYDWNSDVSEMALAAANGLRVSNHSYGANVGWAKDLMGDGKWAWMGDVRISSTEDYRFGFYEPIAAAWDEVAYNAPYYLMVKAAGNDRGQKPRPGESYWLLDWNKGGWIEQTDPLPPDGGGSGFDTVVDAGNAKNILTIGAVADLPGGYTQPSSVVMTSFSGWGPTDDGRIKPDLVTDGVGVYSMYSGSNTSYSRSSGTSMAAASATGSIGLLLEHEKNLRGTARYLSSTLKALLIHTADEAGASPGPDYVYGWGLINTSRAAQVMTDDALAGGGFHLQEHTLASGGVLTLDFRSDGNTPLRATIAWTDPPGASPLPALDPATGMLVNDLDLSITGPDGATYAPWILDPSNPSAAAQTGLNTRDNVEQVHIAAPVTGVYTVRVAYRKGNGSGQNVSLITSGVVPPIVQEIALQSGWNSVSLNVTPALTSMAALLSGVAGDVSLVKDGQGRIYSPIRGITTLSEWDVSEGYFIHASRAATLRVEGTRIQPGALPIPIKRGWNLIPYPGNEPADIEQALSGIAADVVLVKDASGGLYYPEFGINTLGQLRPGSAYRLYARRDATLVYPSL